MSEILEVSNWAIRQWGWLGHSGKVYKLGDKAVESEPGGFSPLYLQVGFYRTDEKGNKILED
jgi:hypothetical protein